MIAPSRGWRHSRRPLCAAILLLAVGTLAARCTDSLSTPWASEADRASSDAPRLSVGNPEGGNGLYAPPSNTWTGSWSGSIGGHVLCSTDGTPLTLRAVRYNFIKKPRSVVGLVRTVPAASDGRRGGGGHPSGLRSGPRQSSMSRM